MFSISYEENLKKFNKNYRKVRKAAIRDELYSDKDGRALLDLLDALDGVLDEHDLMIKKLQEEIIDLHKKF